MSENFTITFQGADEVSGVIQDISDKLDDLEREGSESEHGPSILISSEELVPEIEQVMWDILEKVKTRAIEDEAEFLLNSGS
jgi:hypothetical protein